MEEVNLTEILDNIDQRFGLILRADGSITLYAPHNEDKTFNFPLLKSEIGCQYGEIVQLSKNAIMICDEEGLLVGKPVNKYATKLYQDRFNINAEIVGDVVVCHTRAIK